MVIINFEKRNHGGNEPSTKTKPESKLNILIRQVLKNDARNLKHGKKN